MAVKVAVGTTIMALQDSNVVSEDSGSNRDNFYDLIISFYGLR